MFQLVCVCVHVIFCCVSKISQEQEGRFEWNYQKLIDGCSFVGNTIQDGRQSQLVPNNRLMITVGSV